MGIHKSFTIVTNPPSSKATSTTGSAHKFRHISGKNDNNTSNMRVNANIEKISFVPSDNNKEKEKDNKSTSTIAKTKKKKLDDEGEDKNKDNNTKKRRKLQDDEDKVTLSPPTIQADDQEENEQEQDDDDSGFSHPYMSLYEPVFEAHSAPVDTTTTTTTTTTEIEGSETASSNSVTDYDYNSDSYLYDDQDYDDPQEEDQEQNQVAMQEEENINDVDVDDHGVYCMAGEDGEFETVVELYHPYHHPEPEQDSVCSGSTTLHIEEEEVTDVEDDTRSSSDGYVELYHQNYPLPLGRYRHIKFEDDYQQNNAIDSSCGEKNRNEGGNANKPTMISPLINARLAKSKKPIGKKRGKYKKKLVPTDT